MRTPTRPEKYIIDQKPPALSRGNHKPIAYEEACERDKKLTSFIPGHPLASSAGSFKNDPFWDEMMASIQNNRRELDAEFATSE